MPVKVNIRENSKYKPCNLYAFMLYTIIALILAKVSRSFSALRRK